MKSRPILTCFALLAALFLAGPALADEAPAPLFVDDMPQACAEVGESPAVTEADLFLAFHPPQFANPAASGPIVIGGGQCNQAVCGSGQFCCNYSCSTCAPLGGACTQQYCPPES